MNSTRNIAMSFGCGYLLFQLCVFTPFSNNRIPIPPTQIAATAANESYTPPPALLSVLSSSACGGLAHKAGGVQVLDLPRFR